MFNDFSKNYTVKFLFRKRIELFEHIGIILNQILITNPKPGQTFGSRGMGTILTKWLKKWTTKIHYRMQFT